MEEREGALTSGLSPDLAKLSPEGLLLYLRGSSSPIPLLTPSQGEGLLKPLVLHTARVSLLLSRRHHQGCPLLEGSIP